MKKIFLYIIFSLLVLTGISACGSKTTTDNDKIDSTLTNVKHLQWSRNAVIYEVNLRQYSYEGSIKAFKKHLPRLKELGVDILWFMPVHPISKLNRKGELGSYYAVQDYTGINPEFGTIKDFTEMVEAAHANGMKVILDWVPNHSGCDNEWVKLHPNWYVHDATGKMIGPYDWTDVYKLDYSNRQMRGAMIDALKFWVRDVDVDGFRCDVASEVPIDFWETVRPALDAIKPVFMLAESQASDLTKDAFDMVYNWPLKDLFNEIVISSGTVKVSDEKKAKTPFKNALALDSLLVVQAKDFPKDSYMMNMITNHDLNSWEGSEFKRYGAAVRAFAVLSYTMPGMPLIYTGQETGMDRSFEFFKKDTAPDWTKNEYFYFYKSLNELKHYTKALRAGDYGAPVRRYHTVNPNLYIFSRIDKDGGVYVFLNLSNKPSEVKYKAASPTKIGKVVEHFSKKEADFPKVLAPWQYCIYEIKK